MVYKIRLIISSVVFFFGTLGVGRGASIKYSADETDLLLLACVVLWSTSVPERMH
jgi:hypothetical protein